MRSIRKCAATDLRGLTSIEYAMMAAATAFVLVSVVAVTGVDVRNVFSGLNASAETPPAPAMGILARLGLDGNASLSSIMSACQREQPTAPTPCFVQVAVNRWPSPGDFLAAIGIGNSAGQQVTSAAVVAACQNATGQTFSSGNYSNDAGSCVSAGNWARNQANRDRTNPDSALPNAWSANNYYQTPITTSFSYSANNPEQWNSLWFNQ